VTWLRALAVWAIALSGAAGTELQRLESVEPHMGTLVRVTVYTGTEREARQAFRAAFDRIRHLDQVLSDYRPDSELNRITRTAVGRAVRVSDDLFTVLAASQELAGRTDGAFDITQGPVIRLWREARTTGRLPDPAALDAAARRTGFRKLHLDTLNRTVRLDIPDMALDVGAIGKGYAASEAIAVLTEFGVRSALVAISGDLAFSEAPPGQRGWRIGVDVPDGRGEPPSISADGPQSASPAVVPPVLELTNAAVSTSGASEQHVDAGGRRYSHIIDPSSRMGLADDIRVTVVARHGLYADGLDTAISVLGVERGLALVEQHEEAAAIVFQRGHAGLRAFPSSRFLRLSTPR
jgi:thiamine biosynthesis lipoprotein